MAKKEFVYTVKVNTDGAEEEVQKVAKHLRLLSDLLSRLDYETSLQGVK